MPMIEGFGDEVTYAMMIMFAVILITACWLSTQLRFIPFVNVFVLESMQDLIFTNVQPSHAAVHVTAEPPLQPSEPLEEVSPTPVLVRSAETTSAETAKDDTTENSSESNLLEDADKDSENLASNEDEEDQSESASAQVNESPVSSEQNSSETVAEEEKEERKEKQVKIKLMYLNNTQRIVDAYLSDTIGAFRQSHFRKELSDNKMVRFIFNGKALGNDTSTLSSCNVKGNSIIHCLITPSLARRNEESTSNQAGAAFVPPPINEGRQETFIERVVYPFLIILFAIIWYQQFAFEDSFIYSSIMPLLGVVLFLLAMSLAFFRAIRFRAIQQI
ncbi:and ubiquitin-like domain-containing 1 [Octopus vulgaris]|uniref:And ubiquitin-like domain-containing 1 n=1 Tax=Octopus vulgaris TaxID=6645 RepID=A0AA36F3S4_OCTVU|nr:and ubiquitin-like domain-containing 1 [Octopus vulgaris]